MRWRATLLALAALAASAPLASSAAADDISHVVRPGETPAALAKVYHVPLGQILSRNPGLDPARIKVGDIVFVPRPSGDAAPSPAGPDLLPDEEVPGVRYVVAPGDFPAAIAERFGISLEDLCRQNPGLDPKNLAVGRVLAIPQAHQAPPPVAVTRPGEAAQAVPLIMDFQ